jgi:alpha-N-arabinofuranosidase
MFSRNLGDELLAVVPAGTNLSDIQGSATRDSKTGEIFVKLVNPNMTPQSLPIEIKGVTSLKSRATVITLSANPEDTNSIRRPRNVVPVTTTLSGVQPAFAFTMPPFSVVVLKLKPR